MITTPEAIHLRAQLAGKAKVIELEDAGTHWYPCGFASVNIKPARGKFVAFCKQHGIGRPNSYHGGYDISVRDGGQSLTLKEAYANEYARVLAENGINATVRTMID